MLWIMFHSPQRGVLLGQNGSKLEADELAQLVGKTEAEVKQGLSELKARAVYSTTDSDEIYSRRMLRDEKQRLSKVEAGRKGGKISRPKAEPKQSGSSRARAGAHASSSSPSSSPEKKQTVSSSERKELDNLAMSIFGYTPVANISSWLRDHDIKWVYEALRITEAAKKKMPTYTNGILQHWASGEYPERKFSDMSPKQRAAAEKEKADRRWEHLAEQYKKGEAFVKDGRGTFREWLRTKGFSYTEEMQMEKSWIKNHGKIS